MSADGVAKEFEFRPSAKVRSPLPSPSIHLWIQDTSRSKSPGMIGRLSSFARSKNRSSLNEGNGKSAKRNLDDRPRKVRFLSFLISDGSIYCTNSSQLAHLLSISSLFPRFSFFSRYIYFSRINADSPKGTPTHAKFEAIVPSPSSIPPSSSLFPPLSDM